MASDRMIVMAGTDERDLTKLAEYEAIGGYDALLKARAMSPNAVIDEVIASELRGRGGAFFPTGRKWSFVPKPEQNPNPHYVVVNADESEPGSFKDNEIMARVQHRFFEGCLIAAHAIESKNVFVYIRGEYTGPYEILLGRAEGARARTDLRGDVTIVLHRGAGAYICGRGDGAARVPRGQARPAAPAASVPGDPGSLRIADADQQRRDAGDAAADHRAEAEFAHRRPRTLAGTRVVSLSGQCERRGTTRSRTARACAS